MMRSAAALLLVAASFGAAPVRAGEVVAPVCGRQEVLEQLAFTLRRAGRPAAILPAPVGEVSGPGVAHCAAYAELQSYDTVRYGRVPVRRLVVVPYALKLRRNGIFLELQ